MVAGQSESGATAIRPVDGASARGLNFARTHCSACHAVNMGISPKREAPSFEAVVNAPGLTADTLKPWLRDSHNYPEVMNFAIEPAQIDDLVAYMLTLQNSEYTPPTQ
ncbi:mono/diheme cytochrome c family protein [Sphingobium vermicomposti]|uniref:Mono/diheme cytochrome c family protein n=2 Tax=Sphingobium vermicomposti TaxID=529005 RepID=A0A846M183_9SPHN|nr:mono/diheme cytochrome c family protein [Sphingobium vermicomposti]